MKRSRLHRSWFLALGVFIISCASQSMRFAAREPVVYFNDIRPIPLPASAKFDRFDYYATVEAPRPAVKTLVIADDQAARDVNSLDQVPACSWFLPRLGAQPLTADDLVRGATEFGPPHPPLTVFRVRHAENNPRFFVRDNRNLFYLLKFDPPGFPHLATTTSFIVNRLFWAFGYHVPEDHLFVFKRAHLIPEPASALQKRDLDRLLVRLAGPENGAYRCIASRIVDGLPLGPTPERGVRSDDPNDLFPHQSRRVLRALYVFAALANWVDIGPDHTLDVYVGDPGAGYVKHYLVDFDDALGTFAARTRQLWSGYNHLFSISDILGNLLTAGFVEKKWEKVRLTEWPSVGAFEADLFDPLEWKETMPFDPIRQSQPADRYWAAKILLALRDDHLSALVRAAGYPDAGAEDYMIETLKKRRDKILLAFLEQVSPVEIAQISGNRIRFQDLSCQLDSLDCRGTRYHVQVSDGQGTVLSDKEMVASEPGQVDVDLKAEARSDYMIIHIRVQRPGQDVKKPAEFHFLKNLKLVGVVHK